MAQLAIKGHKERGKEVIEILEMLGGNNPHKYTADCESLYFYIDGGTNNIYYDWANNPKESSKCLFTLEEFEEKFPYKVGDKVITKDKFIGTIIDIKWQGDSSFVGKEEGDIIYTVQVSTTAQITYQKEDLQPYKEETMEEKKINQMSLANCDLDEVEIILGDKFELKIKEGKYYAVKKKLHYPKTYEECCEILNIHPKPYFTYTWNIEETNVDIALTHHHDNLLNKLDNLRILLICRDAYWKIAGEQMGLGKPWKPDFTNYDEERYGIYTLANKVERDFCGVGDVNMILSFPTEEMRDAFYENFKDLIEQCKELL